MTKSEKERDSKYKIMLFLSVYSLFVIVKLITDLAYFNSARNPSAPSWPGRMSSVITVMLWCVCFLISITISKQKIFQSKAVNFLFAGFSAWILWGAFTNFSGLSFSGGWRAYRECIVVAVFTHTLYMAVKIVKIYDLKRQIIGITVLMLGAMLLCAFIVYFRGFAFIDSLLNLFQKNDRFRYSYGFKHVNTAGRLCIMFFIYTIIYRTINHMINVTHKIRNWVGGCFYCIIPCGLYDSYIYSIKNFNCRINSFLARIFTHESLFRLKNLHQDNICYHSSLFHFYHHISY